MTMEDVSKCITRVTHELRTLQQQLQWTAFQRSDPGARNRIVSDLLNVGLIRDLKNAVDHVRHFLWSYVDAAAANCTPYEQTDHEIQSDNLTQITEMLRLLHGSS